MRCFLNLSALGMVLISLCGMAALAQTTNFNNLGRTANEDEIRKWDIAVGPSGKELPAGSGTPKDGAAIFAKKCVACHGPTGEGTKLAPRLIAGKGTRLRGYLQWPFATTIWDFINRAMPLNQEGTLSADEVYAVTAFLLKQNEIIQDSDVLDSTTLPKIQMPNRKGFTAPPTDWKPGMPRPFRIDP